ncbi:MAG TPA: hypothetical protein VKA95_11850 [Nitrososphaeraceae archaeon]|nr:hypothetical protein [Nitrososphaeraceae archaeon]
MSVGSYNEKMEIYLQKYANMVEALTELTSNAICNGCSRKLRNILQKYGIHNGNSHQGGGHSSLEATNEKDGLTIEYSTNEYK